VALVVHRFPEPSEGFLVDHALGLLADGIDVHVVTGAVDRPAVPAPLADRVHARPRLPGLRHLPLLRLRPDVVHTEFLTIARDHARLATRRGWRLTSSIRGYDVAYAGLADPAHYRDTWPALAAVHVLGEDLWARARERGAPADLPHVFIPPAVDVDRVERADPGGDGPLRLLSVGRLHWKKGHHHVLAALARLVDGGTDATLRIVGDGTELEAVAFARHQLGLDDRVELVGGLARDDVGRELGRAQVFVHGAVTEGFGNAVLEAQAAGLPVVCTDAEGLRANVADGETGLVVPRRDPEAMAAALARLGADPGLRTRLGAAGRERVAAGFRPADQRAAFVDFFTSVVA
jgi:colanic acid/amylovoran biosynthesis glycosyltransferase